MTIREYLIKVSAALRPVAGDLAPLEARLLLGHVLNCDRAYLIANPDNELDPQQVKASDELISRRLREEPIAKIIGYKEFWGLRFMVTTDTLDPRPDTETLIEGVLEHVERQNSMRILDLGTGTGCIVLSLLHELKNSTGIGVDLSQEALNVAKENARELSLSDRAEFILSNWGQNIREEFDVIVSNPPYITEAEYDALSPTVRDYEPKLALVAGDDGLDAYRKIAITIDKHLANNGIFAIELGINQEEPVATILKANNLEPLEFRKDLAGIMRCIIGRRIKVRS